MRLREWRRPAAGTLLAAVVMLGWNGPIHADPTEATSGETEGTLSNPERRAEHLLEHHRKHHHKKGGLLAGLIDLLKRMEKGNQSGGGGDPTSTGAGDGESG